MAGKQLELADARVGWIGAGVMGRSMCSRLIDAGCRPVIYTRTREKANSLLERGAKWADSARQAADGADVVFSMVGLPADVRDTHLGPNGTLASLMPGAILVDMSTSQPALAREIAERAAKQGVRAIDAPVSGGDIGARQGTLSIMIGGDPEDVETLAPFWNAMGSKWVWQGPSGAGQNVKAVNQILAAAGMVGVCEALLYGYRAGLDLERVLESVASGAAGSWALSNLGPRIIRGDFAPGFFVEHFLKDMEIILDEARRMNLALPGLALAQQLYRSVAAQGGAMSGTQALILALARMSDVVWPSA